MKVFMFQYRMYVLQARKKIFLFLLLMLGFLATISAQATETAKLSTKSRNPQMQTDAARSNRANTSYNIHKQANLSPSESPGCKGSCKKMAETQLREPSDKKIHLLGVTLTPGGFLAGEGVWRSRNEQTDIGSTFNGLPLGNSPLAHMHELRFSARQSRISLLIEGPVNPYTLLSGYYEMDFLGNGSANSNESNSYDLRIRELYATLDKTDWGLHLLAGQNWSLSTMNSKGITPRNEVIPPTIDAQYVVGFVWKRQPQFRLTKNFGSSFWTAVSLENPQTTFGGTACGTALPGITSEICSAPGTQTLPSSTTFSLNHLPDLIAKLAYESKIKDHKLHIEGFGLYRDFYDRVQHTDLSNTNKNTTGLGVGVGIDSELVQGVLDLEGNLMAGRGIGSYASGSLPDATLGLNGELVPIPEFIFMLGATLHASPTLDLYVFGGEEKETRKYFQASGSFFGYGVPTANNSGCSTESGVCTGNTKELWQVTMGMWDKFYKGAFGELRVGLQYSYTRRNLFSGVGGGASQGYNTNDQMIFASLRYYPFT